MKTQFHLLKYLKFRNVLKCTIELDKLVKEKNTTERIKLLKEVKDCVIDAISEIAKNCLVGNIPLTKEDFDKLSKYQNILRLISKPSTVEKRRNIIIQRGGGFIDTLIPAALILITYIINNLIEKNE